MLPALGTGLTVLVAGVTAWLVLRWVGDVLNPPGTTAPQRVPFTGGYPPTVHAWRRYHARYYTMSLLFLAFDMEMVWPWCLWRQGRRH